jgi:hypothetical protein
MFINTHCIMDCNSAKKGHCSPRLITLWIAQFVGALCVAAPSTDTWPKGSPFLATKVSRLWGEGLRPRLRTLGDWVVMPWRRGHTRELAAQPS